MRELLDIPTRCTPSPRRIAVSHALPLHRAETRRRWSVGIGCWVIFSLLVGGRSGADTPDRMFLDGLRDRQLFRLAELTCQQQLSRAELSQRQRAEWVAELVRTYSLHAANSTSADQARHWDLAAETASKFLDTQTENPFRLFVALQAALGQLARGELARIESELSEQPAAQLESARHWIRQAERSLEQIDRELADLLQISSESGQQPALSEDEMLSLRNQLRYYRARAYRNQALCYPPDSDDRTAALTLATEQLNQLLTLVTAEDPLLWKIYCEQVVCYRLLEAWDQSQLVLDALTGNAAPPRVKIRGLAEQVRNDLAMEHYDQALRRLEQASQAFGQSAELDFAALETYLANWQVAAERQDSEAASHWQQQALDAVTLLEQQHGVYWARRGEMLMLRVAVTTHSQGNIEILARVAANLYRKGQFEQAIQAYQRAAQQAQDAAQLDDAFQLQFKAGLVAHQRQDHAEASRLLRQLALDRTTHEQASQVHLLAVWNAAQTVRNKHAAADPYAALLREHLGNWPQAATADTARMWLGRLYESRRNWKLAVSVYREVQPQAKQFAEAVTAAGRVWRKWLQQKQELRQPVIQAYQEAVDFFRALIVSPGDDWPETWSPVQQAAAVAEARLRLSFPHAAKKSGHRPEEAVQLLTAALNDSDQAADAWRQTAMSLLVVALSTQAAGHADALEVVDQLADAAPAQLLDLVGDLASLADDAGNAEKEQLAQLQLAVLARLEHSAVAMEATQRQRAEIARAEALSASGQADQALEAFRQLASSHPDNRRIQMGLARQLSQATDPKSCQAALDQWRRIAERLKPDSDNWYLAKYSIAKAYFQLGKTDEAVKRLRYLKATSAVDLSAWKTRVDALLAACQEDSSADPKR